MVVVLYLPPFRKIQENRKYLTVCVIILRQYVVCLMNQIVERERKWDARLHWTMSRGNCRKN